MHKIVPAAIGPAVMSLALLAAPAFAQAPIRIGVPAAFARSATSATFSGPPMLPGLRRMQCAPASIAFSASVWLKWMSAMIGIGDSTTIVLSASMSLSRGTATRTMSAPASTPASM